MAIVPAAFRNALCAILVVASLGSCASAQDPGAESRGDEVTAALFPTGATFEANLALREEAVTVCMLNEGFEYAPRPPYMPERNSLMFPTLGTWTTEIADMYGFGFMRDPYFEDEDAPTYQPAEVPEHLAAEYNDAYLTCRSSADEEVNGSYNAAVAPLRVLLDELRAEFLADPRVVVIQQDWAQCMRLLGYEQVESYPQFAQTLLDASDDFVLTFIVGRKSTDEVAGEADKRLAEERRAALAAVGCAEPLRDDFNEIWDEFQTQFFDEYEIPTIAE